MFRFNSDSLEKKVIIDLFSQKFQFFFYFLGPLYRIWDNQLVIIREVLLKNFPDFCKLLH